MSARNRIAECEDLEVRQIAENMLGFPHRVCIAAVRDGLAHLRRGTFDDEPFRWVQRAVGDRFVDWRDVRSVHAN